MADRSCPQTLRYPSAIVRVAASAARGSMGVLAWEVCAGDMGAAAFARTAPMSFFYVTVLTAWESADRTSYSRAGE